jgi:hypothetical protein
VADEPTTSLLDEDGELLPPPPRPTPPATEEEPTPEPGRPWSERNFWVALLVVVVAAAVVRVVDVLGDHRFWPGGDGFDYHFSALRLAQGLGYTRGVGTIGVAAAHHPPGWTTLLGGISWLGATSFRDHQFVGVVLGLGVVALAGLVGRAYFNPRTGLVAAVVAAAYPGFWLLEANVLSEPLGLVLLGVFLLLVRRLRDDGSIVVAVVAAVVAGLLALTRPEQVVVVVVIVVPTLLAVRSMPTARRVLRLAVFGIVMVAVISPWSIYNTQRFHEPVFLSTGDGGTLLAANCAPGSFEGPRLGFWDNTCNILLARDHPKLNAAQMDREGRSAALDNLRSNIGRWPVVVAARFGRLLGVFRPSQTVGFVATWMSIGTGWIWAWVVSFWIILAAGITGAVMSVRRRIWVWPLIAPAALVVAEMAVFYGEPRYHTMADLGVLVFAGFAVDRLLARLRSADAPLPSPPPSSGPRSRGRGGRVRSTKRPGRLPSVHLPG